MVTRGSVRVLAAPRCGPRAAAAGGVPRCDARFSAPVGTLAVAGLFSAQRSAGPGSVSVLEDRERTGGEDGGPLGGRPASGAPQLPACAPHLPYPAWRTPQPACP